MKVRGRAISVVVKRSDDRRLERMTIETLNGANVTSPSGRDIQTGREPKIVAVKVSMAIMINTYVACRVIGKQMVINQSQNSISK